MKSYHVLDVELSAISTMNRLATLFYSLCGSSFTAAFSLWSSMQIDSAPSAVAKSTMPVLEWVFVFGGVLFGLLALTTKTSKQSTIDQIKRESEDN